MDIVHTALYGQPQEKRGSPLQKENHFGPLHPRATQKQHCQPYTRPQRVSPPPSHLPLSFTKPNSYFKRYFADILALQDLFLRMPEGSVRKFGVASYILVFQEFKDKYNRQVPPTPILLLISHRDNAGGIGQHPHTYWLWSGCRKRRGFRDFVISGSYYA